MDLKKASILAFLLLGFLSCKKESDSFDGPGIQDIYGQFQMINGLASSMDTVDFAAGETVFFTAEFNKIVDWQVHVIGQSSGAKKIISGRSKSLDQSNALWNGSMTELPLFREEECKATLYIDGGVDSSSTMLYSKSAKKNNGLLIADFETGMNPAWTVFVQTGANMDFAIHTDNLAPQGLSYLSMAGTVNWDWLIGLIDFNAAAYSSDPVLPLSNDAENNYFNCLIYGEPGTNKSLVLFQFKEDENEDGIFDPATEDQYDFQVWVEWSGWKLVSIKYADIPSLVNGQPSTPKGNQIHNSDKISKISMLELADPSLGHASTKIDYIIMSNGVLEP